jgi:hypothetical protein
MGCRSSSSGKPGRAAAQLLTDGKALRPGITIDGAAAAIFAIGHPEIYRGLVLDGDCDDDAWANWLQATLEAALLVTRYARA